MTGDQYIALDNLTQGNIQARLVKFPEFTINIAHIVSIVCIDKGLSKLPAKDAFKEVSEEDRARTLRKMAEMKKTLFNKDVDN